jgi:hypothetical protein
MSRPRRRHLAAGLSIAAIATLAGAIPAAAKDGDVIRRGACSAASDWKLKASEEDGAIELEGEVDTNVNGQTWNWRIGHDGRIVARGTARTVRPSGSFEVRRVLADHAGVDRFGFRAVNPATGEVCQGAVQF